MKKCIKIIASVAMTLSGFWIAAIAFHLLPIGMDEWWGLPWGTTVFSVSIGITTMGIYSLACSVVEEANHDR
jgi:hypothetical protein